ncbi:hypothetical protein CHLNCDRAFT_133755 [Chlorella variabilis]|uniref:SBP-type domain-containing protein n=1 Tax=Chlorella variabilis TaxID=554065 RepID=E1ZF62_CHLVA|nr:hypothetical protein CHLNCDRAFT_133755 [Chlorella variabilis]EFN55613.1 hypothetical protein CHLNCDRAFT_133755 [Chlorella variabilis]|eukprot:XP_005847715.1 hypothetical protein CHLNCDRAFT_133755 [Chlorella variabilis]
MSYTEGADPEWRMEAVDWSPVDMTARPRAAKAEASTASAAAAKKRANMRCANYCCQVEGCPRQLLPLRSYYQRQHICEEHFRALAITDASGHVSRFCQQCTKLEPLSSFDGERRSCRVSLDRRNQRRQGKRGSGGANSSGGSGSGSGSVTRLHGDSPIAFAQRPSLSAEAPAALGGAAANGSANGWTLPHGPAAAANSAAAWTQQQQQQQQAEALLPGPGAGGVQAFWVQQVEAAWLASAQAHAHAQAQSDHSASFYGPGPASSGLASAGPSMVLPAPQPPAPHSQLQAQAQAQAGLAPLPAPQPVGAAASAATVAHLPEVAVSAGGGGGTVGGLSSLEMDQLLAMDADCLADAILRGSGGPAALPSPLESTAGQAGLPSLLPSPHPQAAAQWPPAAPAGAAPYAAQPAWGGLEAGPSFAQQQQLLQAQMQQQQALLVAQRRQQQAQMQELQQRQQRAWHQALMQGGLGLPPSASMTPPHPAFAYEPAHASLPPPPAPSPTPQLTPAERLAAAQLLGDLDGSGEGQVDLEELLFPDLAATDLEETRLYGVRPEQLPAQLRGDLMTALALPNTVVQATMRSGCVHLTLTALLSGEERWQLEAPGGAAAALARLLPLARQLPCSRMVAQVGASSAALLAQPAGAGPAVLLSLPLAPGSLPTGVALATPLATTVSAAAGRFPLRCSHALLAGAGAGAPPLVLHCRRGGLHLAVSLAAPGAEVPLPAAAGGWPPLGEEQAGDGGMEADGGEDGAATGGTTEDPDTEEDEDEVLALAEEEDAGMAAAAAAEPAALVEAEAWVPAAAPQGGEGPPASSFWQPGWGLYEFEMSQGALVGEAAPVLVLPDAAAGAAAELATVARSPLAASLLRLAGLVLAYLEDREAAGASADAVAAAAALQRKYPPLAVARVAAAARKLLDVAERARWPVLTRLLLPAAAADGWRPAEHAAPAPAAAETAATAAPLPAATADPEAPLAGKLAPPEPFSFAKPGAAGEAAGGGKASGSGGKLGVAAGLPVPELSMRDGQQRVMHPAVLGAATLLVAGVVLGVGVALVTGHLA